MGGSVYALTSPFDHTNDDTSEYGYAVRTVWDVLLCLWRLPTLGI